MFMEFDGTSKEEREREETAKADDPASGKQWQHLAGLILRDENSKGLKALVKSVEKKYTKIDDDIEKQKSAVAASEEEVEEQKEKAATDKAAQNAKKASRDPGKAGSLTARERYANKQNKSDQFFESIDNFIKQDADPSGKRLKKSGTLKSSLRSKGGAQKDFHLEYRKSLKA